MQTHFNNIFIPSVNLSDAGEYTCNGINETENQRSSFEASSVLEVIGMLRYI